MAGIKQEYALMDCKKEKNQDSINKDRSLVNIIINMGNRRDINLFITKMEIYNKNIIV
jgi:hypothetical protein